MPTDIYGLGVRTLVLSSHPGLPTHAESAACPRFRLSACLFPCCRTMETSTNYFVKPNGSSDGLALVTSHSEEACASGAASFEPVSSIAAPEEGPYASLTSQTSHTTSSSPNHLTSHPASHCKCPFHCPHYIPNPSDGTQNPTPCLQVMFQQHHCKQAIAQFWRRSPILLLLLISGEQGGRPMQSANLKVAACEVHTTYCKSDIYCTDL